MVFYDDGIDCDAFCASTMGRQTTDKLYQGSMDSKINSFHISGATRGRIHVGGSSTFYLFSILRV